MKIGIVTLDGNFNYGNRLQNYAVYNIINNYVYSADTIIVKIKEDDSFHQKYNIKQIIKKVLPSYIVFKIIQLKNFIEAELLKDVSSKRIRIFSKFTVSQISGRTFFVNKYKDIKNIKELQKYDYILTGSDQVWNPYFAGNDYYFLTFVPPEKRIGFIASIGVSELPNEQKERYAKRLNQMKYISVREESAVQIIEELIHKKVDCFPDPVLLLEKKKWEKLMQSPIFNIPKKYILSFFLGEEPKEKIELFAEGKDLMIVHMNQKEYKEYYLLNPEQLLYMIKKAEIILTDSFHVSAFSIIFQKQFYVFQRKEPGMENMFSRMENLLEKFHLSDRIQDGEVIKEKENISKEQYQNTEEILREERNRFDKIFKNLFREEDKTPQY